MAQGLLESDSQYRSRMAREKARVRHAKERASRPAKARKRRQVAAINIVQKKLDKAIADSRAWRKDAQHLVKKLKSSLSRHKKCKTGLAKVEKKLKKEKALSVKLQRQVKLGIRSEKSVRKSLKSQTSRVSKLRRDAKAYKRVIRGLKADIRTEQRKADRAERRQAAGFKSWVKHPDYREPVEQWEDEGYYPQEAYPQEAYPQEEFPLYEEQDSLPPGWQATMMPEEEFDPGDLYARENHNVIM